MKCSSNQILNPKTNRCVKRTGRIGKAILKSKNRKSKTRRSVKKSPKKSPRRTVKKSPRRIIPTLMPTHPSPRVPSNVSKQLTDEYCRECLSFCQNDTKRKKDKKRIDAFDEWARQWIPS
jgi:hypothetical protein